MQLLKLPLSDKPSDLLRFQHRFSNPQPDGSRALIHEICKEMLMEQLIGNASHTAIFNLSAVIKISAYLDRRRGGG
ncbi:hypothetical protein [Veronia pacifica]|uniref:hypothetical protein n=1 Tax=Veronia pacifica TaxID=1080227 RepID=UPI001112D092|nr:hypothetical protein [Veronia pacifica]